MLLAAAQEHSTPGSSFLLGEPSLHIEEKPCDNHFALVHKWEIPHKNWGNFHIDQTEGRLVKCQLKMPGMAQKKLYRTTLTESLPKIMCKGFTREVFFYREGLFQISILSHFFVTSV